MKKYLKIYLILTALCFCYMSVNGQNSVRDYEQNWKRVDEFVEKRLPKSALEEVKKIFELAKRNKQEAQIIKSLIYLGALQSENREDNQLLSIKELEGEMKWASGQVKSILTSILAEKYYQFYQSQRWKLFNRAATTSPVGDDPATWSAMDFHNKIGDLYLQSISEKEILQRTSLADYDALLTLGNTRMLRPTLYDLLVHRALNYFQNDERDLTKPAYEFQLTQSQAFAPAETFANYRFATRDSLSLKFKALTLFQSLLLFHGRDTQPDALLDVDLLRLQYIYQHSIHPEKDALYLGALTQLANQYGRIPAAAQAWYLIANFHHQRGSRYKPKGDEAFRFEYLKAAEICREIILRNPKTEGGLNASNLLQQILEKHLSFEIEKVNVPDQPFRVAIEFKNFSRLYLKLVKVRPEMRSQLENLYDERNWNKLLGERSLKSWSQDLPDTKDHQSHRVEVKVEALPLGEYVLLAGTDEDLRDSSTVVGARMFHVSAVSFVNNGDDYFVLHRQTGKPLAGATVQLWKNVFNSKRQAYDKQAGAVYTTDSRGFFRMKSAEGSIGQNNFLLEIKHQQDKLFMNELFYSYRDRRANAEKKAQKRIFFFTDRSLYRPGQTVYFKGIVLNGDDTKLPLIIAGAKVSVLLRDANGQDIDSVNLATNQFGSISGNFKLPESGLMGDFSLFSKSCTGEVAFKVEEYKRPTFVVEYAPVKGTYAVNDTINLSGKAVAYAGNTISGAKVVYRIVRESRMLYPWLAKRWFMPNLQSVEIANGETTTDVDGKFVVPFQAQPDMNIERKLEPVFDYQVYVDVTDINGETRSAEKVVSVSYKSLVLKIDLKEQVVAGEFKSFGISTANLNDEPESAALKVRIARLKSEDRLIRARYWERPDLFVLTKAEYVKYFPNDEYDEENTVENWAEESVVLEKSAGSDEKGRYKVLLPSALRTGVYKVEVVAKDKKGDEIKDVRFVTLSNPSGKQLARVQYLISEGSQPIQPGEKTSIRIGSSAEDVFLIQSTDSQLGNKLLKPASYTFSALNNEAKSIPFTATESLRGGYGVSFLFVKHNRVYQFQDVVQVPWKNKELKIDFVTHRDKTLPGSDEKWKVKISGHRKEQVAAEMLASMYDASLDQFYFHQWNSPAIWPGYFRKAVWNGYTNFNRADASVKQRRNLVYQTIDKRYDEIVRIEVARYEMQRSSKVELMAGGRAAAPMASDAMVVNQEIVQNKKIATAEINEGAGKGAIVSVEPTVRRNFNEMAFFFPDLRTDKDGNISFGFTMPESLTRWKFQALAHTRELAIGYQSKEIVTQKELMVQPNVPRFLREGDRLSLSTKIVNLSDGPLTGTAILTLYDAQTGVSLDGDFGHRSVPVSFSVARGQSVAISFPLSVPEHFVKMLRWKITAKAGQFTDGEENILPVLSNRILVTESLPLSTRGTGLNNVKFEKLLRSDKGDGTLQSHSLTVEYTANPAWYAVQALPYLMEYPYDCAEQTWNRYFANALGSFIAGSNPKIKTVFDQWSKRDTAALFSALEKNQELKSVLLTETPWVLAAKTEQQQKKNLALLFDMVKMDRELSNALAKLKQMQNSGGGFVWFKGGPDDRYMTQYILTGIGHLKKIGALKPGQKTDLTAISAAAIAYLDQRMQDDYNELIKGKSDLKKYQPGQMTVQYLYMRSFFPEIPIPTELNLSFKFFRERAVQTWTAQNQFMQGMIALSLFRTGDATTPKAILSSLKETAIQHDEIGTYWKGSPRSWWWYDAPIERQALLIEVFEEVGNDKKMADDLRTWLLKNKQTNHWDNTKATAEACYALLLRGSDWLNVDSQVTIQLGKSQILSTNEPQEAGTGYFKKIFQGNEITADMGDVSVKVASSVKSEKGASVPGWGAVYWQYFENLDKITPAETPLKLVKELYVETPTDKGLNLKAIQDLNSVKVGDKIKVRIVLEVDRDMEYVHLKDMRASGLEPVNVLSGYKWQGGLGYYETTKDAGSHFFFNQLLRGKYVFEYSLFVNHKGNFSNGIATVQCMYAPEFTAHSKGTRLSVE